MHLSMALLKRYGYSFLIYIYFILSSNSQCFFFIRLRHLFLTIRFIVLLCMEEAKPNQRLVHNHRYLEWSQPAFPYSFQKVLPTLRWLSDSNFGCFGVVSSSKLRSYSVSSFLGFVISSGWSSFMSCRLSITLLKKKKKFV